MHWHIDRGSLSCFLSLSLLPCIVNMAWRFVCLLLASLWEFSLSLSWSLAVFSALHFCANFLLSVSSFLHRGKAVFFPCLTLLWSKHVFDCPGKLIKERAKATPAFNPRVLIRWRGTHGHSYSRRSQSGSLEFRQTDTSCLSVPTYSFMSRHSRPFYPRLP